MKKSNKLLLTIICIFIVLLSTTLFVSFSSNVDVQEVVVKSITPVYDSNSTIEVDNNNVVFNDKNQTVEYKVVIENTQNYDIKINDITLSTPTEEFLTYEVDGIDKDDVLGANSTKELTIYLETTGIKGWGRNFSDELTANISFEKAIKPVKPPTKHPENEEEKEEVKQPEKPTQSIQEVLNNSDKIEIDSINGSTIEFKDEIKVPEGENVETWIYPEAEFYGYKEVDESRVIKEIILEKEKLNDLNIKSGEHNVVLSTEDKEVLGYVNVYINDNNDLSQESPEDGKIENPYTSGYGFLTLCLSISGTVIVGIFLFSRKKPIKYIILILALSSTLTLVNAEETIELPITLNVSFESQNVMKMAYKIIDDKYDSQEFWIYREQLKNIYIENEVEEIFDYEYKFDVTESGNGRVIAYLVTNNEDSSYYDLHLQADGIIYPNTNASYYFSYMKNLNDVVNMGGLDTQNVISMEDMFYYTGANNETFELDLSSFNTKNVTNMRRMFARTANNTSNFVLDLSSFDTSNVTDMSGMFNATAADSTTSLEIDVSSFDTSNVTDMSYMFSMTGQNVTSLTLDISNLDTSKVTDMSFMFNSCGKSDLEFELDLSNFDTSKVTDMSGMFVSYGANKTDLVLDLSNFDTSNVTDMNAMFNATGKNSDKLEIILDSFNTSNVTNMSYMFTKTGEFSSSVTLDISNFDTSKVTDMKQMFAALGKSDPNFHLDLSNLDTSMLNDCYMMFYQAFMVSTKFNTSITIKNPNVTSYDYMFNSMLPQEDSQIKVNYTSETEKLVDKMIATKSSNSNIVKGNLIVDVDNLSVGDEIHISGEKFNVISQTDDTVTILAKYNIDSATYKQNTAQNNHYFADGVGWEYSPGPKDVDIQVWGKYPIKYINPYIEFLKEQLNDSSISGDLITLKQLENLGCEIDPNYSWTSDPTTRTCVNSDHITWLSNTQTWWTRSAGFAPPEIWYFNSDNTLDCGTGNYQKHGIRPTITISKETLRNLG